MNIFGGRIFLRRGGGRGLVTSLLDYFLGHFRLFFKVNVQNGNIGGLLKFHLFWEGVYFFTCDA